MAPYLLTLATLCFACAMLHSKSGNVVGATGNRVSLEQLGSQRNQYFLNEFCDLESKTLRHSRKLKQDDTYSLFLLNKLNENSARIQKSHRPASSIKFGFGSSSQAAQEAPVKKQLNCSINVVAPRMYGLLMTIHSIDFPVNLTKLSVTLYQNATHSQSITIGSSQQTSHLLLTQPENSKIGINLLSFQPIDWSTIEFDILFTVYKKGNLTGCPNSKWFDCGENICVPASLVCDGNRNCPNGNDELVSYLCHTPLFLSIATLVALAVILIVLTIVIVLYVNRRKQTDLGYYSGEYEDDDDYDDVYKRADNDDDCYGDDCGKYPFGLDATIDSSRIDLTLDTANVNNGYLTNNLYSGGFKNPVWTGNSNNNIANVAQSSKPATLNAGSLQRSMLVASRSFSNVVGGDGAARSGGKPKRTTFKH